MLAPIGDGPQLHGHEVGEAGDPEAGYHRAGLDQVAVRRVQLHLRATEDAIERPVPSARRNRRASHAEHALEVVQGRRLLEEHVQIAGVAVLKVDGDARTPAKVRVGREDVGEHTPCLGGVAGQDVYEPTRDRHQRSAAKEPASAATSGGTLRSCLTRRSFAGGIACPTQAMASASADCRMRSAIRVPSRSTLS